MAAAQPGRMPEYADLPFHPAGGQKTTLYRNPLENVETPYATLPAEPLHDQPPATGYVTDAEIASRRESAAGARDRKLANKRAGIGKVDDGTLNAIHDMFGGKATRALPETYANETVDASNIRGAAAGWNHRAKYGADFVGPLPRGAARARFTEIKTRYFGDAEQNAATVHGENGLLVDGTGAPVDTTAATGIGTYNSEGRGKHIYAMGEDDGMRAVDPWAAHRETRLDGGTDDPGVAVPHALELVNHSSLIAGGRAAAAGEISAAKGKLQQVSDQSGHYRPDNPMLHQAVKHFADEGVDMHDVAVKMVGKTPGQRPLIASAREFMQHEGASDTEKEMRAGREELREELEEAAAQRPAWGSDPRAGRGPRVGRVVPNRVKPSEIADRGGPGRVKALADLWNHFAT